MQKILVVEDDWELNDGLCYMLQKEGFYVWQAHSVEEGKTLLKKEAADLVILDVNLPDGEGFSLAAWLKDKKDKSCLAGGKTDIPVLFLTARDMEEDALKGYEMGAEDYVTKPFSMKVLMKKIDVILKRSREEDGMVFDDGFLSIDLGRAKVTVKGGECAVTPTEFRILQEFLSHRGQLLTYDILLRRLWDGGNQFVDKHALAVNMGRLRGKIEDGKHKYISNVYGMGYQWLG